MTCSIRRDLGITQSSAAARTVCTNGDGSAQTLNALQRTRRGDDRRRRAYHLEDAIASCLAFMPVNRTAKLKFTIRLGDNGDTRRRRLIIQNDIGTTTRM